MAMALARALSARSSSSFCACACTRSCELTTSAYILQLCQVARQASFRFRAHSMHVALAWEGTSSEGLSVGVILKCTVTAGLGTAQSQQAWGLHSHSRQGDCTVT
eukprot:1113616-Pelagomonas_calceolata.AAC.1